MSLPDSGRMITYLYRVEQAIFAKMPSVVLSEYHHSRKAWAHCWRIGNESYWVCDLVQSYSLSQTLRINQRIANWHFSCLTTYKNKPAYIQVHVLDEDMILCEHDLGIRYELCGLYAMIQQLFHNIVTIL